jgi:hypothetical protein
MRIRIKFIIFVSQPQSSISIEDLLAQGCEELFKDTSAVNTSPEDA